MPTIPGQRGASLTAGVAALWFEAKGGRQALRARAEAAGTTVQAMFNACVSHQITKPDHWHNRGDLGDVGLALRQQLGLA